MKAVVAAFNQEKALVGAFSVITNLRMEPVKIERERMNTRDVLLFKLTPLMSDSRKALVSSYPAMGHPANILYEEA